MTKQLWFKCLKSIVLSTIASLGAFVVCGLVIAAALNSIKNDESNGIILADSKDMAKFVETETKYWQPVLNLIKSKHCGEEKGVEKE